MKRSDVLTEHQPDGSIVFKRPRYPRWEDVSMSEQKPGPFGGLSASEAGRKSWETRRKRQAEAAEVQLGPAVSASDTDEIIRSLPDKAKAGDIAAARMLLEYVEIKKENEGRGTDKRLLELLSPTTRHLIEGELRLGTFARGSLGADRVRAERARVVSRALRTTTIRPRPRSRNATRLQRR